MVHMSYVPVLWHRAESNPGRIASDDLLTVPLKSTDKSPEIQRRGVHRGTAHEEYCEANAAATRTTNAARR